MDERMETPGLDLEVEEMTSASIDVPETPADYADMADEDIVALFPAVGGG